MTLPNLKRKVEGSEIRSENLILSCSVGTYRMVRVVIQQGSKFIDGDGVTNSGPDGRFVTLVTDITDAHDFKTREEAETWMGRKSIAGTILEIDGAVIAQGG